MNRRLLTFILTGLAACGFVRLGAEDAMPAEAPAISTSTSPDYPAVTCTSADALAVADTLQMAKDVRDQLGPLLSLGRTWRFPVHIHIMTPDDPLAAKINHEASVVFADDTTMRIEAVLPSTDPDAHLFIQRQFVLALLWERFFANTKTFDTHTPLDRVPVWLIVGLNESLNEDPEHDREAIVKKAVETDRAPTLQEIAAWQQVSKDRLMGLWQRAFCFYLVDTLIVPGERRNHFQKWFTALSGPNPTSAQRLFPTEASWQRELVETSQRSPNLVYSWDETAAQLAALEVFTVPTDKPNNTRSCTLDTAGTFPRDKKLLSALQSKVLDLTALELRAHPGWRAILATYRFGLTALINDPNASTGQKMIQQAHEQRVAEVALHQKLVDYVNWFEVTKDFAGNTSHFRSYFSTAQEMQRVEADPAHPNPIRADLLQIESQL